MPFVDLEATTLSGGSRRALSFATAKKPGRALNAPRTVTFGVPIDDPHADFLLEGDALIKAYERDPATGAKTLTHHCRLVTAHEQSAAGIIACSAADPLWVLARRLIGKSTSGYSKGTAVSPVDSGAIIADILAVANAEAETGVGLGTVGTSVATNVQAVFYKPAADAILELVRQLDGPDINLVPIEYTAGKIARLDVPAYLGSRRPSALFEHGGGKRNVENYERPVTLDGTANRIHTLPPSYPNSTDAVLVDSDPASIAQRGLLETVLASDLQVTALRQALTDYHLQVRKGPRQTIVFTPAAGDATPRLGRDFDIGDIVPFRAWRQRRGDTKPRLRIDAELRVFSAEVDGDNPTAPPTLTLVTA